MYLNTWCLDLGAVLDCCSAMESVWMKWAAGAWPWREACARLPSPLSPDPSRGEPAPLISARNCSCCHALPTVTDPVPLTRSQSQSFLAWVDSFSFDHSTEKSSIYWVRRELLCTEGLVSMEMQSVLHSYRFWTHGSEYFTVWWNNYLPSSHMVG